ncbi:hypothetical protein B0H63DRAFT_523563 [Podospora didyma]|uniref:Uncharacterized protein n=1 Tax=Podospora didyma TaxID=330526 RepID=A0AAE0NFY4_9PEZI|nr:hypothetical protein B0H63DRAFT_523563 [Podospora didyma]
MVRMTETRKPSADAVTRRATRSTTKSWREARAERGAAIAAVKAAVSALCDFVLENPISGPFLFMKLLGELRNMIYEFVVEESGIREVPLDMSSRDSRRQHAWLGILPKIERQRYIIPVCERPKRMGRPPNVKKTAAVMALLRTSKHINVEFSKYLYRCDPYCLDFR